MRSKADIKLELAKRAANDPKGTSPIELMSEDLVSGEANELGGYRSYW